MQDSWGTQGGTLPGTMHCICVSKQPQSSLGFKSEFRETGEGTLSLVVFSFFEFLF
jgi:hypothetical protein